MLNNSTTIPVDLDLNGKCSFFFYFMIRFPYFIRVSTHTHTRIEIHPADPLFHWKRGAAEEEEEEEDAEMLIQMNGKKELLIDWLEIALAIKTSWH